jgi:haloalkane dehalogenase
MTIKNTPAEAFASIPDYPFEANLMEVGEGLTVHYLDEGPKGGPVVLLLHGEPSWSFLYRFMIPVFAEAGYRVVAPDLIGFGKSSKPTEQTDYTYASHLSWMTAWLDNLGLTGINLFCQDWGGLIGLRLLAAQPDKFDRLVVGNTGLPTGEQNFPKAFLQWQKFSQTVDVLPVGKILQNSTVRKLSDAEVAAYEAPYPDPSYMAGAKIFPSLVPTSTDDPEAGNNKKAWAVLMQWNKPTLTLFSDSDPITKGGHKAFQKFMPGAQGQQHTIIEGAGHFLQEDKGPEIAKLMIEFIKNT